MATSDILLVPATKATFTLTLASLANGSGRQSTMINNSGNYPGAIIYMEIESNGSAPTVGTTYNIYLLRGNDPSSSDYRSDGAGASDAALTVANAILLGQIVVVATANKKFYAEFDTLALGVGFLGPEWGIAVVNNSGQSLNATEGNHFKGYVYTRFQSQ